MFDENKEKPGIAPIGWANDDMSGRGKKNTFESCIRKIACAGLEGSEVSNTNTYPTATEYSVTSILYAIYFGRDYK